MTRRVVEKCCTNNVALILGPPRHKHGDGPNTVSESTVSLTNSVSFFALTEFQGENSVSSEFLSAYHVSAKASSPSLSSETVLSKQHPACFLQIAEWPEPPCRLSRQNHAPTCSRQVLSRFKCIFSSLNYVKEFRRFLG